MVQKYGQPVYSYTRRNKYLPKIQPVQEVIQKVHQYYGLPKSPPA